MNIKTIGVLTSGGDAPGMNPAIRAVVRAASFYNIQVMGIYEGFDGMLKNQIEPLGPRQVKNILQRGGTLLKSSRSAEFRTKEGRAKAYKNLQQNNIDALIIIGGDGSFTGGWLLSQEFDIPVIGIPGTIDNDLYGTDFTLGYDTATNTVVECIDKIRDTAESHNRLFFVEVMGRDTGFIALRSALASGAVDVVLPEESAPLEDLLNELEKSERNQKTNRIVVVAEGNKIGTTHYIAEKVKEHFPHIESKITILGHLQRGGHPTCTDRVLASQLGVAAVEALRENHTAAMVGIQKNEVCITPIKEAIGHQSELNTELIRISKILST